MNKCEYVSDEARDYENKLRRFYGSFWQGQVRMQTKKKKKNDVNINRHNNKNVKHFTGTNNGTCGIWIVNICNEYDYRIDHKELNVVWAEKSIGKNKRSNSHYA